MENHINNMMQCLLLATQGAGYVSPNPLVGAMLVHDGNMIGAGYHQQYGTAHAEVNCLASVSTENKHLIAESTMYVNLEPCNHHGNTPPCTDAILAAGIKKVIVGSKDVNEKVNGTGIQKLKENGVEVIENVLEQQCLAVNRRFFTYQSKKRPYIILKWAESQDGFVAVESKERTYLTGEKASKTNHQWRTQEDAILVGFQTALNDNPQLNVRHAEGRDPVRILWDPKLELPASHAIMDGKQPTIVMNDSKVGLENNIRFVKLKSVEELVFFLYENKTLSIIIEGGPKTIQKFLDANLWDEARIIKSEILLENGYRANQLQNEVYMYSNKQGTDEIFYFKNNQNLYL
jgi:diaminohydroxyphosphoribosylaminopyrimidine deaminase / 5-amino-6-(5-phosphoribosylamino)uracil reductase